MRVTRRAIRTFLQLYAALCVFGAVPFPSIAKDSWVEVRSPHFTVISNAGEKEARRTADQFEQFREVFHTAFPTLRIDTGRPLIIFAVKNEDSLKALLPAYWETKGHAHPSGIYASGEERDFVAVRTNIEGENPYEVVYHEYAHAILNLNFRELPVWLSEGLAEYFGNSRIRDNEVDIGIPSRHLVVTLQQSKLIPIEELLLADQHSPYYNEENRVSVFYAESWAIVHYLLIDPNAQQQQLLMKFLKAWEASGNQVEAAQKAFGDLKKFSQTMEAYARNQNFMMGTVKTSVRGDPKSFASREMPGAELSANRALFYVHTRRPAEAETAAREALAQDAELSLAYEAQGLNAYVQEQFAAACPAFLRAAELPGAMFSAYYFAGTCRLREGITSEAENAQVIANLEKAISLNPLFAPGFANLASIDSLQPGTMDRALQLGRKALELDPGNLQYAVSFAHVLLNAGRIADAKALAARIQQAAWTPRDKEAAGQLQGSIADYDEQSRQAAERARYFEARRAAASAGPPAPLVPAAPTIEAPAGGVTSVKDGRALYMAEGVIADAECNATAAGRLTLTIDHSSMRFLYTSLSKLEVIEGLTEDSGNAPSCAAWKGRRARLFFYKTKDKPYAGELKTIQFF